MNRVAASPFLLTTTRCGSSSSRKYATSAASCSRINVAYSNNVNKATSSSGRSPVDVSTASVMMTRSSRTRRPNSHYYYYYHSSTSLTVGIDKVAENQIAEWLNSGGDKGIKKGGKIKGDDMKHKGVAYGLGLKDDYIHSKILADNNIKPECIIRRIELDNEWTKVIKLIQKSYNKEQSFGKVKSIEEYIKSSIPREQFYDDHFIKLDLLAKKCNDAIISDTLRFNGRAPVPHAKRFLNSSNTKSENAASSSNEKNIFEERIREALSSLSITSS